MIYTTERLVEIVKNGERFPKSELRPIKHIARYNSFPGCIDYDSIHYNANKASGIIDIICSYFGVEEKVIRSKTRLREVVSKRQIAMFMIQHYTKLSLSEIGRMFGGKDHATVIHSCKAVRNEYETNKHYRAEVNRIHNRILNG